MTDVNVTQYVDFDTSGIDSELMPVIKCICGRRFDYWDFYISVYRDTAKSCPGCGKKLYFVNNVSVYEVDE